MQSKETFSDLSNRDRAYLKVAIALAETSECRMRHGAVIVRGGSVNSCAVNRNRNHPLSLGDSLGEDSGTSIHAEIAAIKKCSRQGLVGAVLYVARINKRGEPMLSRPCNRCYTELLRAGIKEMVFTTCTA